FAVRNSPPPPSQGPDRPATAERFSSTCDSIAQTITALLAPGANYPGKTVLPEWVQACALLLVRSYPTGRSSTISSQHGAIKRTNAFLIRGRCPACNLVRSARRNQCRNSPPRGRTTGGAPPAGRSSTGRPGYNTRPARFRLARLLRHLGGGGLSGEPAPIPGEAEEGLMNLYVQYHNVAKEGLRLSSPSAPCVQSGSSAR